MQSKRDTLVSTILGMTLVLMSHRPYKVGEHIPQCQRTMLVLCVTPTPRSVGSVSPSVNAHSSICVTPTPHRVGSVSPSIEHYVRTTISS